MPRPPCPSPIGGPALDVALLDRLADHLLAAHRSDDECPTAGAELVRIRSVPDGIDLGLLPLPEGLHPADVLLGYVVPNRWSVAGVVASGTARRLDDGTATRVGVAVLVDRHGRCVHHLDGEPSLPDTAGVPIEGRIVDLLRRALRLATSAPAVPPSHWWDVVWVDALVADASSDPVRPRRFEDLVHLHPLVTGEAASRTIDDVRGAGSEWNDVDAWRAVRRAAMEAEPASATDRLIRRTAGPYVSSDVAEWMDEGCLARWLLDALPPIDILLETADDLLRPDLSSRLRAAIGRTSLR